MTFKETVENNPIVVVLGVISLVIGIITGSITIYKHIKKLVANYLLPSILIGIGVILTGLAILLLVTGIDSWFVGILFIIGPSALSFGLVYLVVELIE